MDEYQELIQKTREAFANRKVINAALLQRKFRIEYPKAAHVIIDMQIAGMLSNKYDRQAGGYRVLW